jgi:hypothetical protein
LEGTLLILSTIGVYTALERRVRVGGKWLSR